MQYVFPPVVPAVQPRVDDGGDRGARGGGGPGVPTDP